METCGKDAQLSDETQKQDVPLPCALMINFSCMYITFYDVFDQCVIIYQRYMQVRRAVPFRSILLILSFGAPGVRSQIAECDGSRHAILLNIFEDRSTFKQMSAFTRHRDLGNPSKHYWQASDTGMGRYLVARQKAWIQSDTSCTAGHGTVAQLSIRITFRRQTWSNMTHATRYTICYPWTWTMMDHDGPWSSYHLTFRNARNAH